MFPRRLRSIGNLDGKARARIGHASAVLAPCAWRVASPGEQKPKKAVGGDGSSRLPKKFSVLPKQATSIPRLYDVFFGGCAEIPSAPYLRNRPWCRATPSSLESVEGAKKSRATHVCGRAPEEVFRYATVLCGPESGDRVVWEERRSPSRSAFAERTSVYSPCATSGLPPLSLAPSAISAIHGSVGSDRRIPNSASCMNRPVLRHADVSILALAFRSLQQHRFVDRSQCFSPKAPHPRAKYNAAVRESKRRAGCLQ